MQEEPKIKICEKEREAGLSGEGDLQKKGVIN